MNKVLPLAFALGVISTSSAQASVDADLSSLAPTPTYSSLSDHVSSAETKRELAYNLSR